MLVPPDFLPPAHFELHIPTETGRCRYEAVSVGGRDSSDNNVRAHVRPGPRRQGLSRPIPGRSQLLPGLPNRCLLHLCVLSGISSLCCAVVRFAEPSVVILRDQFMKSTHYLRGGLLFCWVKKTRRREQPQRRCRAHTDRRVRLPGEQVRSWRAPRCCL